MNGRLVKQRLWLSCGLLAFTLVPSPVSRLVAQDDIRFTDVTADTGIDFVHTDGSYGQFFLIESMSGGLAVLDYDNDGNPDIQFLNGAPINRSEASAASNQFFRNEGNFRFSNVTDSARLNDAQMSLGVVTADFDNDGFQDIYISNYGPNVLYHNNGDGTYSDWTEFSGVSNGHCVGGGVSFFDMDADGDLDLYAGNYIQFDPNTHEVHMHKGLPAYPSPLSYEPAVDTLFENMGNGTFADVSDQSGIRDVAGRSMGLVALDTDQDGDVDVFVANDTQENFLFENDGLGNFEEIGLLAGVAYDFKGKPQASMGVAVLDFDRDGLMDIYVTSFSEEFSVLYRNAGGGLFDDVTLRVGGSAATFPHVTWGVAAGDFDNNETIDLMVGAGDLDVYRDQRGGSSSSTAFKVANILLRNEGSTFRDLQSKWGPGAGVTQSTRGLVAADLNGNGLLDIVALNSRSRPTILKNDLHAASISHSHIGTGIRLRLVGRYGNRDGFGTVVSVQTADLNRTLTSVSTSSGSYQSGNPGTLHVAATHAPPLKIEVRWPQGPPAIYTWNGERELPLVEPH